MSALVDRFLSSAMRLSVISLPSLLMSLTPLDANADPAGPQNEKLLQTINGIPVHQISVSNFPHSDVNITLNGLVDEPIWQDIPARSTASANALGAPP